MTSQQANTSASLADEIRRQLGSPGVTRYFSSLPPFAVDPELPEGLSDLVAELQRAEANPRLKRQQAG